MEQHTFLSSLAEVDLGSSSEDEYEQPPEQSWKPGNQTRRSPAVGVQLSSGATAKLNSLCGDILKDALASSSDDEDHCSDSSECEYDVPSSEKLDHQQALERTREQQWKVHEETGMSGIWIDGASKREYTIVLNVYKLPYYHVFGAYHTGVEIDGIEYAFRAGDHEGSGVFECRPCNARGYEYKESVLMGVVDLAPQQVDAVLKDLNLRFRARDYSLTHRNCNHYSDALCSQLIGRSIPKRLNRLASIGASLSSSGGKSLQQREKEHSEWEASQQQQQQELCQQRSAELNARKRKISLNAIYMRGTVERRFESFVEVDGSRKVIELRRLPDFELLKVTRIIPPITKCNTKWAP